MYSCHLLYTNIGDPPNLHSDITRVLRHLPELDGYRLLLRYVTSDTDANDALMLPLLARELKHVTAGTY